ncbi:hypothetical protein ACFSHT_06710 [Paraburkholderia silviterrae]|uniref:Uncharacterized protein n=1 Tax=Paraburkholderia silviterrae TaxID=2528715 RepID=A0A4R5MCC7_9BURK|nr:hypothetical protein [Paraburkholderia silviterrae]TDG24588.1 hypothetical protein EYW47_08515 [Paraburkholderia silviterrae]
MPGFELAGTIARKRKTVFAGLAGSAFCAEAKGTLKFTAAFRSLSKTRFRVLAKLLAKLEAANYSNKIMDVAIAGRLAGGGAPKPALGYRAAAVTALTPRIGEGPGGTRIISAP